jgi:hypothetical protein
MEDRRRKTAKKEPRKTPQMKIKELKKDIDAFQSEVDNLLKNVSKTLTESTICVVCEKTTTEHEDLICQHVICPACYDKSVVCPICIHTPFHLHRFDSSSSSDEF